jgi:hypothetical protein
MVKVVEGKRRGDSLCRWSWEIWKFWRSVWRIWRVERRDVAWWFVWRLVELEFGMLLIGRNVMKSWVRQVKSWDDLNHVFI